MNSRAQNENTTPIQTTARMSLRFHGCMPSTLALRVPKGNP